MSAPRPTPHNLPRELTRFVGRERELTEVRQLVDGTALVTLAGAGGAGKTRLALRVARELAERGDATYADGVWLVELAPLADPLLVPRAVAVALGIAEEPHRPVRDTLTDVLRPRRTLLVLDNCEHLVGACADLADALLRGCPDLRILATSREPLGVAGETIYRVPPLGVPSELATPEALARSEAGRLFIERAGAVKPGFAPTEANAEAVARVCRRLDGLPLAIELAAARVAALSPADIAARLDDAFRLLTGGGRLAPPRQQTLRAAIRWGYDLLAPEEQWLFDRLSVFAGGFTLEGAEALGAMASHEDLPAMVDVLDVLTRLVAKSLVQAEPQEDGSVRYRLLEPLRQFARERLIERGAWADARGQHALLVAALAEQAAPELRGPHQVTWFRRLEAEWDNIRAAHDWAVEAQDTDTALRLAGALWWWWARPDRQAEGRERLLAALALPGAEARTVRRAEILGAVAALSVFQNHMAEAAAQVDEALGIARACGDEWVEARALGSLALLHIFQGNPAGAAEAAEHCLALARRTGHHWIEARALHTLADLALGRADPDAAIGYIEASVRASRQVGDPWSQAMTLNGLGDVARARGEYERAGSAYQEAMRLFQLLDPRGLSAQGVLHNLGYVTLAAGESRRAASLFLKSADQYRGGTDRRGVAECVMGLASCAVRLGQPEMAARLFGAAEAGLEALGTTYSASNRADYERSLELLRQTLDAGRIAATWTTGRTVSLDEALSDARALALEPAGPSPPDPLGDAPPPPVGGLTAREREVALLLARGLTNRQVAEALVITEKTAANHVQHVLDKLGLHSRAQLAARAHELGLCR